MKIEPCTRVERYELEVFGVRIIFDHADYGAIDGEKIIRLLRKGSPICIVRPSQAPALFNYIENTIEVG